MNRERIEYCALIAEIVGAIAVVISVIYLALQINDNTSELEIQGHFQALSLAQRPLELLIANPELSVTVQDGYAAPEKLSAADWRRFSMYHLMGFNAWEYLFYARRSKSIPDNLWQGADSYYRELVSTEPSLQRFWSEQQHVFDEPFHSYADGIFQAKHWQEKRSVVALD